MAPLDCIRFAGFVAAILVVSSCSTRADDGLEYPLGSLRSGISDVNIMAEVTTTMNVDWVPGFDVFTFGFPLCRLGDEPVSIERFEPVNVVAPPVEVLGTRLLTADMSDIGIIAEPGWPPTSKNTSIQPIPFGAGVETPIAKCVADPASRSEFQVGLRVTNVETGGGWDGVRVIYREAGSLREFHANYQMYFCGTSTGACVNPSPTP